MNGLLTYSGIVTKIRAMEGKLLSYEDFCEMASLETVPQAVEFLQKQPSYHEILKGMEENAMHRRELEVLLFFAHYRDFEKLYRFSNMAQRKFLDLYFMLYEIEILKKILRTLADHRVYEVNLSIFYPFFQRHSKLDWQKTSSAATMEEWIRSLAGSVYYEPLSQLHANGNANLFDYEETLDLLYLKTVWKLKDKVIKKKDQEILIQNYGSQIDMQNIMWIYRFKKFYHMEPEQILPLLIPFSYRLKKEEISGLIYAEELQAFFDVLKHTYYASWANRLHMDDLSKLEALSEAILNQVYSLNSHRHPYSIASLNGYLYFKEQEIKRIITIIEGIRYKLDSQEILQLIHINKGVSP